MKHQEWIIFAIVGLVLVTGLALMYSGGDLRTAGEAKRLTAQSLPSPGGLTAQSLPAPQKLEFSVREHVVGGAGTYFLNNVQYTSEPLIVSLSSCNNAGSTKFRVNGYITNEICVGDADKLLDGSVIVVTGIAGQTVNFVHVR